MSDPDKPIELKHPFWAKCGECDHCWIVAYYPMELAQFAMLAKRLAICPMCASEKAFVAKQKGGTLLEEHDE